MKLVLKLQLKKDLLLFDCQRVILLFSLPRYKHDNKIKGFAFIEFANAEEAERACKVGLKCKFLQGFSFVIVIGIVSLGVGSSPYMK